MPAYSINVCTESRIAATLTVERDSLTALRIELARFVGQLLVDHADLIWEDQDWRVDVSDENGLILYVIHYQQQTRPRPWGYGARHSGRSAADLGVSGDVAAHLEGQSAPSA